MSKIHLLGTSHISADSVKKIKTLIPQINPDFICVELDQQRVQALLSNQKPSYSPLLIRQIGLFGYIFAVLGGTVQRYLGKKYGLKPGSDMKATVVTGSQLAIKVALIDQPISITLRKLSKTFTIREFFRIGGEIFGGLFMPKRKIKQIGFSSIDISQVPPTHVLVKLISYVKKRYPSIYSVLIHERNIYMSKRIKLLIDTHQPEDIFVVVGAGHVPGMKEILKDHEIIDYTDA